MADQNRKWLIKTKLGKIKGPFATAMVIRLIEKGEVSEEDFIAIYPTNNWIPISHESEFYDTLINLISEEPYALTPPPQSPEPDQDSVEDDINDYEESRNRNFGNKKRQAPKSKPSAKPSQGEEFKPRETSKRPSRKQSVANTEDIIVDAISSSKEKTAGQASPRSKKKLKDIELSPKKKAVKKARIRSARLPGIILILVAGLTVIFFMLPQKKVSSHIRLIGPERSIKMSRDEIIQTFKRGSQNYFLDTFSSYYKAQGLLASVVEAYPAHLSALSMLCMTYLELWPYSYKDSKDLKTIQVVMKLAAKIDPAGSKGNPCNAIYYLVKGETEEADSFIDGVLNSVNEESSPPTFYYYLKALSLQRKRSFDAALGYITSVEEILPQWLRPYVLEAILHSKLGNFSSAARRYKQILDINNGHKEAMIRWGLIEHQQYFRYDQAKTMLKRALAMKETVPASLASDAFTSLAEISIYENDSTSALKYAEQAFEKYPTNRVARTIIQKLGGQKALSKSTVKGSQLVDEGDVFEKEGDCTSAQALYKAAFEKNPKYGLAALKAAKCLWTMSLSTDSIEWLNKAIKADPNLVEAYITLADYYSQRYDYQAAASVLVKANKVSPQNFEIFRSYALIEFRRKNFKGAITYAKKALELFESDVETYILLVKAHLNIGQVNEAYGLANRVIELNPNNREANIVFARTLSAARGTTAGIEYLSTIVSRYPLILEYRLALGKMYVSDERYNDARTVFEQILSIDPKYKIAKIELGKAYIELEMLDPALDQFLQAAVMDPADAVPLFEAGLLYLKIQKPNKAKEQFERVLRINSLFPLVHYYIGRSALLMGNKEMAIEYALKERKINPNLADSYVLAAEAYTLMEQYSLCAREYHQAINLRSQGAVIYVKIAICYRLAGNLDIAESMLNQAEKIENGLPDIYREQGRIYEAKGYMDRALRAYDKYLILAPNAPDSGEVKAKIQAITGG